MKTSIWYNLQKEKTNKEHLTNPNRSLTSI